MTLLYKNEHLTCFNYENSENPITEGRTLSSAYKWEFSTNTNKLIYLSEGELEFSYAQYRNKKLLAGQMIVIPAGSSFTGISHQESKVYILRLHDLTNLCECFSLDMLLKEEDNDKHTFYALNTHKHVKTFFELWGQYISEGLRCKFLLKIKIKELFYLLRAYHSKENLLEFFYPILSHDLTFSDFVIRNHFKVKTVSELAELANYSLSGFQKRFRKVFGKPVYHWMKEEKLKSIFHEINNTTKTFKEISSEYGFSSPSHFNDFCKSNFGYPPGILRKKKINLRIVR